MRHCGIYRRFARTEYFIPLTASGIPRIRFRGNRRIGRRKNRYHEAGGRTEKSGNGAETGGENRGCKARYRAYALGDARKAGRNQRAPARFAGRKMGGGAQRHHRKPRGTEKRAEKTRLRILQRHRYGNGGETSGILFRAGSGAPAGVAADVREAGRQFCHGDSACGRKENLFCEK